MTTKAFGAALIAGMLALTTVASVPATAYAASANAQKNRKTDTTTTIPVTETPAVTVDEETQTTTAEETVAEKTAETPASTQPEVMAAQTSAKTADPAGNNGTVKIDRVAFDSHPNNQPHVTCSFQVDFYGFDKGVGNAEVQFELQPPTKDGRTLTVATGDLTPNIGEDAASGGTDLDAEETYTLKFTGDAHEKQGYHVKLTVHAPGSQGADTKHKVFWVEPCNDEEGQVLSTSTESIGGKGQVLPETMPSTGIGVVASTIATMIAAVAAYVATLYRAQLRKLI
jgi:hypothetical protein